MAATAEAYCSVGNTECALDVASCRGAAAAILTGVQEATGSTLDLEVPADLCMEGMVAFFEEAK